MVGVMRYILRPIPGYLALADNTSGDTEETEGGKLLTWAIPDAKFWAWLRSSGNYASMVEENPNRMKRVEANGVGVLGSNKPAIIVHKLTRAETLSKRPPAKPVLIAAVRAVP
jgi:hypothetical protein